MAKTEMGFFFALFLLVVGTSNASPITNAQLSAIMPQCVHPEYLTYINSAFDAGQINTCARQSAFLAQVAVESGQLLYMQELGTGQEYENRTDLGNTQPGDGVKYKGRGPLQLTGRANYQAAGQALGLDLLNNPDQVATPSVGFQTSVWYWGNRGLNALADQNTRTAFKQITKKINGGYTAEAEREKFWETAKSTLGCSTSVPATPKTTKPTSPPKTPKPPAPPEPPKPPKPPGPPGVTDPPGPEPPESDPPSVDGGEYDGDDGGDDGDDGDSS